MTETARDGPRPLSLSPSLSLSLSLSLSFFLARLLFSPLRFAQSVAKQLVCFVRGPSDRLRADNQQTIRRTVLQAEIVAVRFLPRIFSVSHSFFGSFLDQEHK